MGTPQPRTIRQRLGVRRPRVLLRPSSLRDNPNGNPRPAGRVLRSIWVRDLVDVLFVAAMLLFLAL